MRVKDLADLAGTTVRTIRYYHQRGLLSVPEDGGTWRSYGFAHLTRLMRIRWLVESGIPLADVHHMLRPPGTADERILVEEDLRAVLAAMDARIDALTRQRARVASLQARVTTYGRLSPVPDALVRKYAALLARDLPPQLRTAVDRERELVELACYRAWLPADVERLVEGLHAEGLDELCDLWLQVHRIDLAAGGSLTADERREIEDVVARVLALTERVDPAATQALLGRATELGRPSARAAIELAYRSPTYRYVVAAVLRYARSGRGEDAHLPPVATEGGSR